MSSTNETFCNGNEFPFNYYFTNGSVIPFGTVDPNGFCIFPEANCDTKTSVAQCCQARAAVKTDGYQYMFIAFPLIALPILYVTRLSKTKQEYDEYQAARGNRMPWWVKRIPSRLIQRLFFMGLMAYVLLQVLVPIFMRQSIQTELDVGSRNSLIAAESFLVPYAEIFQFIEDIVLVRVNYALGSGDKVLTNLLLHVGIAGSMLSGVAAAVIATILGVIPPVLRALTNPGYDNDLNLYPGCSFIEQTNDAQVLEYWLMEIWGFPGTQLGLVLSGFMLGALQLETMGWLGALALAMTPIIWFAAVGNANNKLLLLAGAEFATAWLFPILVILYLITPFGCEVRDATGVKLEWQKIFTSLKTFFSRGSKTSGSGSVENVELASGSPEEAEKADYGTNDKADGGGGDDVVVEKPLDEEAANAEELLLQEEQDTRQLLGEGLKIMVMDVAIQGCISLSVYLALATDAAEAYQLTALQSALPSYGIAYALGMGVVFKILGPQLLAKGKTEIFAKFTRVTQLATFLLIPLILGSVIPFRTALAFNYGENACAYAKDSQCVLFFNNVFGPNAFGGDYTLPFTFDVFPLGAAVEAVFYVFRAMMLATVDLTFMLWSTGLAVLVFIPVISVASLVQPFGGHAIAFFVAMYIPQVVLIVKFAIRLEILLKKIRAGEKGTWSPRASLALTAQGKMEGDAAAIQDEHDVVEKEDPQQEALEKEEDEEEES